MKPTFAGMHVFASKKDTTVAVSSKRACATWKSFRNTKLLNGLSKNSISSLGSAGFFYIFNSKFGGKNGKWKETNIFLSIDMSILRVRFNGVYMKTF